VTNLYSQFDAVDRRVTQWMARNGVLLLRVAVGIVYLWFGLLKFFPHSSPAEMLAGETIQKLTGDRIAPEIALPVLAAWECLIGLGMISGVALRATIFLLLLQLAGTVTPLLFFPHATFTHFPLVPTLEGQYIIKNIIIISAALVIGATVRGGRLTARPVTASAKLVRQN
jgi:uncharacterized membrane protein YkgB